MRLYVFVVEARCLPPANAAGDLAGTYAKLQMGKHKSRTRTVRRGLDPAWNEEFVFTVDDEQREEAEEEELEIEVFRGGGILGRLRISIWTVLGEETQSLPPTWFSLDPEPGVRGESKAGKILLTISLYGKNNNSLSIHTSPHRPSFYNSTTKEPGAETPSGHLAERLLNRNQEPFAAISRNHDPSEISGTLSGDESSADGTSSGFTFEEAIETMQSREEKEMLDDLEGGILLEQTYVIESKGMNSFLFEPNSQFRKDLSEQEGNTDYHEGPWTWDSMDSRCLKRSVTYTRAATKLLKAVKAIEEQSYLVADGKSFAVLSHVSMPDVPYGNCFQVDLLYKMMPGPQLSSGEACSHLVISWRINFYQSTVMKGVIEGSARQGLKESYQNFADILARYIKPFNTSELLLHKEQLLAPLQLDHRSDWELALDYFCNFTVVSTIFMGLYVLVHILLSGPGVLQGLEFSGLDLPDTFGELFTCGIFIIQGQHLLSMISHFVQARLQRGSGHGVKAQGDGWLLTVALMEGNNLPSIASSGFSDPYVVFSCNGQTRTSSVQLQTLDPQWNEILEFDAMQEPPSVLDVEIFDFDGPFDMAVSLGHAEINFLKHASAELADMWVPLEGKLAQTSQSKLHLRIFLESTKGIETIRDYLSKMEKEVGKKLNPHSPHRNSTFQKHFGLPPEEFLVNDFSCYLKKKMPLQGKLFLSARIVGFYANLFGHKTKFFFLWEDIEDIQVVPPSLATVGSPALLIILRSGRGLDASHGAKSQDEEGRLRFQFQAFMSFNIASRTIMALWRTRTLTYEQSAKLDADKQYHGGKLGEIEDTESFMSIHESSLTKAFASEIYVPMNLLMEEIFGGGNLERKIMEKVGCLNYSVSRWESVRPSVEERHIHYKFNRHTSIFGGEVSSTQQRTPAVDGDGWMVDEVMALHSVPFGDYFRVSLRYKFEEVALVASECRCEVFVGITWMKSTIFQERITRNICDKLARRCREIFELAESKVLARKNEHIT